LPLPIALHLPETLASRFGNEMGAVLDLPDASIQAVICEDCGFRLRFEGRPS